ncbi:hypothetical protein HDV00_008304 [Rhizophlyctis rosea]|nr:hypothetical protein HDV00_008304 [Rhizophlyctis rosea]
MDPNMELDLSDETFLAITSAVGQPMYIFHTGYEETKQATYDSNTGKFRDHDLKLVPSVAVTMGYVPIRIEVQLRCEETPNKILCEKVVLKPPTHYNNKPGTDGVISIQRKAAIYAADPVKTENGKLRRSHKGNYYLEASLYWTDAEGARPEVYTSSMFEVSAYHSSRVEKKQKSEQMSTFNTHGGQIEGNQTDSLQTFTAPILPNVTTPTASIPLGSGPLHVTPASAPAANIIPHGPVVPAPPETLDRTMNSLAQAATSDSSLSTIGLQPPPFAYSPTDSNTPPRQEPSHHPFTIPPPPSPLNMLYQGPIPTTSLQLYEALGNSLMKQNLAPNIPILNRRMLTKRRSLDGANLFHVIVERIVNARSFKWSQDLQSIVDLLVDSDVCVADLKDGDKNVLQVLCNDYRVRKLQPQSLQLIVEGKKVEFYRRLIVGRTHNRLQHLVTALSTGCAEGYMPSHNCAYHGFNQLLTLILEDCKQTPALHQIPTLVTAKKSNIAHVAAINSNLPLLQQLQQDMPELFSCHNDWNPFHEVVSRHGDNRDRTTTQDDLKFLEMLSE